MEQIQSDNYQDEEDDSMFDDPEDFVDDITDEGCDLVKLSCDCLNHLAVQRCACSWLNKL